MDVKLVNRGTTGELLLNGRLTSANAPEIDKIFNDAAARFETVVLNLSGLEYTASSGLRIILRLHQTMAKKGGALQIKEASPMVMEVLEMTGMASFLSFI
ncbi:MAG: STAS domain-containing protein [Clostridia bacterium]|nr:STAS domain-containing protein [Clostridia bacterium]